MKEIFFEDPLKFKRPKNGEDISDILKRTREFWIEKTTDPALTDKTVLISSHGCAVRALLQNIYQDHAHFWHGCVPPNCSINLVEIQDGQARLTKKVKYMHKSFPGQEILYDFPAPGIFFVKYSQGYALLSLWYCDIIYKKVKTQEVYYGQENYECADLSDRAWSLYRNDSVYRKRICQHHDVQLRISWHYDSTVSGRTVYGMFRVDSIAQALKRGTEELGRDLSDTGKGEE